MARRAPSNEINSIKRQCENLPHFSWWSIERYEDMMYEACVSWGAKCETGRGKTELQACRALKTKLDELDAIARRLKSC